MLTDKEPPRTSSVGVLGATGGHGLAKVAMYSPMAATCAAMRPVGRSRAAIAAYHVRMPSRRRRRRGARIAHRIARRIHRTRARARRA
eukprot:COSAG01_NODE_20600_length_945_cov_3.607565_1_plen_87_part_10